MSKNKNTFWSELKRRNIFRVATVYLIVSWIIIQIGDAVFEPLGLPNWALTFLIVFLVIGLPLALILAWAYEMSPLGMVRTSSQEAIENPYSKRKKKPLTSNLVIGILITVVIAQFLYFKNIKPENNISTESAMAEMSIAVLAFDDQSPDGDQEWLGYGIADEILNVLAQVEGLKVSGKTSSFSFKDKGFTIKEIGDALDVITVLEGSVSKVGDRIRITAQLIDVESDKHIWSDKYDRDAADIFAIMDEVAQNIANALIGEISIEELENIKTGYQVNEEAYEYYLKGMHFHINNFIPNRNEYDFEQSEQMFINSISIDPNYAKAYAGLADLYDTKSWAMEEYDRKRDSVINIGYKINPYSPYILMAKCLTFRKRNNLNPDSVFYYLKKAYDLDPNTFLIKSFIASKYLDFGLYNKTIAIYRKMLISDPLNNNVRRGLAYALNSIGNFDEAKENYKEVLELDRNDRTANRQMFYFSLFIEKDTSEAKRIYKKLQQVGFEDEIEKLNAKALILAVDGRKEEALSIIKNTRVYSILNMKEEALIRLGSSSARFAHMYFWSYLDLKNSKTIDFIREEPQFQQWLKEAKIVYEERVRKYGHLFDD